VRQVAAWLVSRPSNAVLGLTASYILFLPLAGMLSGAVIVLLVLEQGPRRALVSALFAALVLALMSLLSGGSAAALATAALLNWTPSFLLAMALGRWRSLTLTVQVSVIVALLGLLAFYVALGDPAVYWGNWLETEAVPLLSDMGLAEQARAIADNLPVVAQQMTVLFVFMMWSLYVVGLLLGYALSQAASGRGAVFGRFGDLNIGRVMALVMAVASVVAFISGANWLRNFAFLVFVVFWIQGLAILHWLHADRRIPTVFLVVVYALIPLLSALPVLSLAVVGYTDAWFGYRTRKAGV